LKFSLHRNFQNFNAKTSIWEEAMSITDESARGRKSMHLDARLPEGNVILCTGHGDEHSFLVRRLGLSVECPNCGQIALSVNLIVDFYSRPMDGLGAQLLPAPALDVPSPTS
jgi:hypothetical protein